MHPILNLRTSLNVNNNIIRTLTFVSRTASDPDLGSCGSGGGGGRPAVFCGRRRRRCLAGLDVQVSGQQRVVRAAVTPLDDVIDQAVDGGRGRGRGHHYGLCVRGAAARVRWRILCV